MSLDVCEITVDQLKIIIILGVPAKSTVSFECGFSKYSFAENH